MRKLAVVALLVVVAGTGCSLLPTLHIGAGVSAVMPEDTENLDTTAMVDLFVKLEASMLQIDMSVGYKQYHYEEESGPVEEDFTQIPVAATVRYVISGGMARVLLGGGLVFMVNDVDEIGTMDVNDPLCYRLVAGVDLAIVSSFKLGLELSYDIDSDVDLLGGDNEFNADGTMARVTMSYHF